MKYRVKANVKVRVEKPENRAGFGWHTQPSVILEADTIEELSAQANAVPIPTDIDIQAISVKCLVRIGDISGRQDISIHAFRQL